MYPIDKIEGPTLGETALIILIIIVTIYSLS